MKKTLAVFAIAFAANSFACTGNDCSGSMGGVVSSTSTGTTGTTVFALNSGAGAALAEQVSTLNVGNLTQVYGGADNLKNGVAVGTGLDSTSWGTAATAGFEKSVDGGMTSVSGFANGQSFGNGLVNATKQFQQLIHCK